MGLVETPSAMPHNDGVSMLSEQAIKKFKEIYRSEFQQEIDDKTAATLAISLLALFDKIYRPIKAEWMDDGNSNNGVDNPAMGGFLPIAGQSNPKSAPNPPAG